MTKQNEKLIIIQNNFKLLGYLLLTVILALGLSTNANAASVPIKIKPKILVSEFGGFEVRVPVVEIISLRNDITIKNVIANNGNCKMTRYSKQFFPKKLKYGELVTAGYTTRCNLLKAKIITNVGSWTYEFDYIPETWAM